MSDKRLDIGDDEIRIIASAAEQRPVKKKRRKVVTAVVAAIAAAVTVVIVLWLVLRSHDTDYPALEETVIEIQQSPQQPDGEQTTTGPQQPAIPKGYTTRRDTTVNGTPLIILTPINATPRLVAVTDTNHSPDSATVLAAQAAGIRKDNGEIVGTFVLDGRLISKGEAKAGYCSIINGELSIGVADATPMLEQAIQTDGYFFRQYPLVAAGQLVENRPKEKSRRKALAEIDGTICIVTSVHPLTFHDFSQSLIDAGARNAIYLVGGVTRTDYTDEKGNLHILGNPGGQPELNVNYIIWE